MYCILHICWGACKEAQIVLNKYPITCLFTLIMQLYAKKRKTHQSYFLLPHCFENALRSTLAVRIANLYNTTDCDDWFLNLASSNNTGLKTLSKKINMRRKHFKTKPNSTWEIFDCFYLVDLEDIIESHWNELASIFRDGKMHKNQILPSYGTKEHLITKMSQIRKARNDIFHNKPTQIKFQKDLEILLLRLDYNLEEAIQIGEISTAVKLQYNYQ